MSPLGQFNGANPKRPDIALQASLFHERLRRDVGHCTTNQRSLGGRMIQLCCQTKVSQLYNTLTGKEEIIWLDILSFILSINPYTVNNVSVMKVK